MTISSAVATLIPGGLLACTNALISGLPLVVSKWELGGSANVTVPSDTISAIPSALFTGDSSSVLLDQDNGLAVFNIAIDESIGDFLIGNLALYVIDPISTEEVLLAVVVFPIQEFKSRAESLGGATGATGNYFLAKLHINLSANSSIATLTVADTHYSVLPTVEDINHLVDPSVTTFPHQILLRAPETGAPALIVRRPGDNIWWGFPFSWPVQAYNFGVLSGGFQGDWYASDNVEVIFGGYFSMIDTDFDDTYNGGTDFEDDTNADIIDGGTFTI